jgi:hypothetical protein
VIKEVWKDIPDYIGLYQASNLGLIKRLISVKCDNERILKPTEDKNGYLYLSLSKNSISKTFRIHKLVLATFVGPKPFIGAVCRHLDGNPNNNKLNNLRWGTQKENSQDSKGHGTFKLPPSRLGSKCKWAKINRIKFLEITKLLKERLLTQKEIGRLYSISQRIVSDIKNNKYTGHI